MSSLLQLGAKRGVRMGVMSSWAGSMEAICEMVARVSAKAEVAETSR